LDVGGQFYVYCHHLAVFDLKKCTDTRAHFSARLSRAGFQEFRFVVLSFCEIGKKRPLSTNFDCPNASIDDFQDLQSALSLLNRKIRSDS
jgi:hypothetical protein